MMTVELTQAGIDAALPRVKKGLDSYVWLQAKHAATDVRADADFRRRFNGFYKVRRNQAWQDVFYDLLERGKSRPTTFADTLAELQRRTGRCEASFASKLVATLDPTLPVIDAFVLQNVGMRLPPATKADRVAATVDIHHRLTETLGACLTTPSGRYLVRAFDRAFPQAGITDMKKLDLVLWQTR